MSESVKLLTEKMYRDSSFSLVIIIHWYISYSFFWICSLNCFYSFIFLNCFYSLYALVLFYFLCTNQFFEYEKIIFPNIFFEIVEIWMFKICICCKRQVRIINFIKFIMSEKIIKYIFYKHILSVNINY